VFFAKANGFPAAWSTVKEAPTGGSTMLSFLYRLIRAFHQEHGYTPNVVTMSKEHYRQLRADMPEIQDYDNVSRFLMLEIILSEDSVHPHVGWMPQAQDRASNG
jgi:hypothetical protein